MIRYLILFLLLFFTYSSQASYLHQFQLSATLAKYYQNVDGGYTAIPISGTQDVKVEVVDVALDQPIWSYSEEQYIENGSISMIIGDPDIDWVNEIENKS